MAVIRGISKGGVQELAITQEGARRILVGLDWDAKEVSSVDDMIRTMPKKGDKGRAAFFLLSPFYFLRTLFLSSVNIIAKGYYNQAVNKQDGAGRDKNATAFDLDLDCYIFDDDKNLVFHVCTENGNFADPSRKVYHSGDNMSGLGGPDDEQVMIETNGLPDNYRHLFLVVKSDSKYSLEEVHSPHVRLADSKTNENLIENTITPPAHFNAHGYVFCHIFRDGDKWKARNMDEYADSGDGIDWPAFLAGLAK
jgi:stress response protein SCP2